MHKVFLYPSSNYQKKLYYFLKNKNCEIYTVNPVSNEISEDNHERHFFCDIFDTDRVVDFLKSKDVKFGFSDQSDMAILPFVKICRNLKLKSNSVESVSKFSCNKKNMYDFASSIGINHSGSDILKDYDQIKDKLPVVIKPVDSTNSRGVYKINSYEDFLNFYEKSLEFSRSKEVIAQRFQPGDMQITVEGICLNNKHLNLTSSLKGPYWSTSITSFLKYPLSNFIPNDLLKKIYDINNLFVEKSELNFGLTHAEYIIKDKEVYLNEIACRGGGFKITSDIVPSVCGINPYEHIFNYIINDEIKFPEVEKENFVLMKFYKELNLSHEKISCIENMSEVLDFGYDFTKHEYKKNPDNPRHSYLLVQGEKEIDIENCLERVENVFNDN